ncbi:protein Wnt-1 [Onthophagus taurus]|uniref:protein Wnt-1 n=1 Tax=Onthophagus taurus TaxID=166361 RepID=UPI0039BE3F61
MKISVMFLCLLQLTSCTGDRDPKAKGGRGKGSMWWGIAKADEPNNLSPHPGITRFGPSALETLRKKQQKLVRENPGVLNAIAKGAMQAISECQHQFRNRRWNCSTKNFLRGKNLFGKIVDKGCRETAFIYAITSAAVTHAVARACSEGTIETCNCDFNHHRRKARFTTTNSGVPSMNDWEWGGCSDNIEFGFKFGREFVDAGERGRSLREKMNLHNNDAGRLHVQSQMRQECKCHGMSGSCTVKTCWMRLPPFRAIGDQLKDRFDGASRVMASNSAITRTGNEARSKRPKKESPNALQNSIHSPRMNHAKKFKYGFQFKPFNSEHKPPGSEDLVYLETSPGFCEKNPKLGILGTHGRQCNDTSLGVDGCDLMCCGRGYRTQEVPVAERCNCTFKWCCEVKCDVCRSTKIVHTCL